MYSFHCLFYTHTHTHTHIHTCIHINLHPGHIYIRHDSLSTAQAGSENNERSENNEPEGIKPKTVHQQYGDDCLPFWFLPVW
jgi:hypothetical protein